MDAKDDPETTGVLPDAPERDVLSVRNEDSSLDVLFRALETREGRLTCYYLLREKAAMSVVELATFVTASTRDAEPNALTPDEIARTRASLTTTHLPKLEAAGLVSCDGPLVSLVEDPTPAHDWLASTFDLEIE